LYAKPKIYQYFLQGVSELGGGTELAALCMATFFFGRRPKFFYYLFAFALEKGVNNTLKLWYHAPRPFMQVRSIDPIGKCNSSLGSPSGHSSSSSLLFIMLFLDIFHGTEDSLYTAFKNS
jgi:membrane-associated phospholipid phosphatase